MWSLLFGRARPAPDPLASLAREVLRLRPGSTALDVLRLVHVAQMLHVGRHGEPLCDAVFEASAMGPMNRPLLAHAKRTVLRARRRERAAPPELLTPTARECLEDACSAFRGSTTGELVAAVHRQGGAWARRYVPDPASLLPISDPRSRGRTRCVDRGPTLRLEDYQAEYAVATA